MKAINVKERRTLEISFDVRTGKDSPYCGRVGPDDMEKQQNTHT